MSKYHEVTAADLAILLGDEFVTMILSARSRNGGQKRLNAVVCGDRLRYRLTADGNQLDFVGMEAAVAAYNEV